MRKNWHSCPPAQTQRLLMEADKAKEALRKAQAPGKGWRFPRDPSCSPGSSPGEHPARFLPNIRIIFSRRALDTKHCRPGKVIHRRPRDGELPDCPLGIFCFLCRGCSLVVVFPLETSRAALDNGEEVRWGIVSPRITGRCRECKLHRCKSGQRCQIYKFKLVGRTFSWSHSYRHSERRAASNCRGQKPCRILMDLRLSTFGLLVHKMPWNKSQQEFSISLKLETLLQETLCQHWSIGTKRLLSLWHLLTAVCQEKGNRAVQGRKTLSSGSPAPANKTYFIADDLEVLEDLFYKGWESKRSI